MLLGEQINNFGVNAIKRSIYLFNIVWARIVSSEFLKILISNEPDALRIINILKSNKFVLAE